LDFVISVFAGHFAASPPKRQPEYGIAQFAFSPMRRRHLGARNRERQMSKTGVNERQQP